LVRAKRRITGITRLRTSRALTTVVLVADLRTVDTGIGRDGSDTLHIERAAGATGRVRQTSSGAGGMRDGSRWGALRRAGAGHATGSRRWSIGGRPYEVASQRARLLVLADLIRSVIDGAGALHDFRPIGLLARRGHTSGVWRRLRAIGYADSIGRKAFETEGRVNRCSRHQGALTDLLAYRSRIDGPAQAAVHPAFGNRVLVYLVIQDAVDVDEVDPIRDVVAQAVGILTVRREGAR